MLVQPNSSTIKALEKHLLAHNLSEDSKMTQELAITNSEKPCLVDDDVSHWFQGKAVTVDDEGVYNTVEQKRYYVRDQVIIICIKRETVERIQPPRRMRMYVTARGEPRVRDYYFAGRKKRKPEETQEEEMLYATQIL
ncbi:hypothetical protein ABBQ38_006233 [Trebouxia sp. C0009 RCD-2024]